MTESVRKNGPAMSKHLPNLNDAETVALIEAAQKGDENAFETLLSRYLPLIDSMARGFNQADDGSLDSYDDLRQEAMIGFYRALMHFNVGQTEVRFGLYAKICIRNCMFSYLRKQKTHEQPILVDDETVITEREDTESDLASQVADEEAYLELSHTIHTALSEYENRIWWLYLSGRTAKEISLILGKDEKSVQNAIYRIRRKLRTVIPNPSDMPE